MKYTDKELKARKPFQRGEKARIKHPEHFGRLIVKPDVIVLHQDGGYVYAQVTVLKPKGSFEAEFLFGELEKID